MKRRPQTRSPSTFQRVFRQIGLGAVVGLVAGSIQVCIPMVGQPPPPWLVLVLYVVGFAAISVVAGLWLKNRPHDEAAFVAPDPTGWLGWLVSFGFGAVFGLFLGMAIAPRFPGFGDWRAMWFLFIVCVGGCGLLSAKYGEDFWRWWSD